ncbi:MAG: RpiB/LacA/LacB family sugar-phosphate isomerase [Deltaproteobacteria bacterium]|jgi:ribose 5-phosphate isomerase B|nr:RpiB/LacA/LacB family sugar-phosphate isomerase [Deltaproteobacteria bacterium]
MVKPIYIGSDYAAFDLKNAVIKHLSSNNHHINNYQITDLGVCCRSESPAYPSIAADVCRKIIDGGYAARGILLCGTGIGMAIAANKFKGIYAATIHDIFSAERSALSNNANVVTLGARVVAPQLAIKLLDEWLRLEYQSGPSDSKLEEIRRLEEVNFK